MTSAFGLWSLSSSASHLPARAEAASATGSDGGAAERRGTGLHLLAHGAQAVHDGGEPGQVVAQRQREGELVLEVRP